MHDTTATMIDVTNHAADSEAFVSLAQELAGRFAQRAEQHDLENTFPYENFEELRASRYTSIGIPEELGGLGATMRQICLAQAELAKGCAATALAVNMHLVVTQANVYRWRHGAEPVGDFLRRVAEEDLILTTSGGSDGIFPSAVAERVEGGYRVSGRKVFCSQAPVGAFIATQAVNYDDGEDGPIALAMLVPLDSDGVEIVETWDTVGMRATASHDVLFTNVFVPDGRIAGRRPLGVMDAGLRSALLHFSPLTASVYYGLACAARDEAVNSIEKRVRSGAPSLTDDPLIQRLVGRMDQQLRVMRWSILGALDELGDDYAINDHTLNTVQVAKYQVVTMAHEVVDTAMDVAGGFSYFTRSPLQRMYRDVRAAAFHPFTPEKTLLHTGRLALGKSVDAIW